MPSPLMMTIAIKLALVFIVIGLAIKAVTWMRVGSPANVIIKQVHRTIMWSCIGALGFVLLLGEANKRREPLPANLHIVDTTHCPMPTAGTSMEQNYRCNSAAQQANCDKHKIEHNCKLARDYAAKADEEKASWEKHAVWQANRPKQKK